MDLNELRDKAYDIAYSHGWHEEKLSVQHFLMLIISELSEAVNADREGRYARINDYKYDETYAVREAHLYGQNLDSYLYNKFEVYIKDTVEDELADVCIRCLDLAGDNCYNLRLWVENPNDFKFMTFTEVCFSIVESIIENFECGSIKDLCEQTIALVVAYARYKNIDIEWHINQKMRYNENRPYKHNKEY